ncbi:MAG: sensor histidine kinase [Chloroflexi bacterium]|nr:MAG: sensor histidine kinase [Chloroflexota bacterium]
MIDNNGFHPDIIFLTQATNSWEQGLSSRLSECGYKLETVHHPQQALSLLGERHYDAVLAPADASGAALFKDIRSSVSRPSPLLAMIIRSETELSDTRTSVADLLFPPNTTLILNQLSLFLRQHKENADLRGQITRLEMQLEEQRRAKDAVNVLKNAIVRNVSHELKTPLLQVKSAVALIIEDEHVDEKLASYAMNATARLEALVQNITMLGSSLDIHLEPIMAREAIESALRKLRRSWHLQNAGERIIVELESSMPPVVADKNGLSTVLQLLLDNALKFSEDKVTIRARRLDNDHIQFEVEDKGIGIAKDQLEVIFELFYQVDGSSTRRYGGTGIGLALVKLILEAHGTPIRVESKEKQGSKFWFILPVYHLI